MEQIQKKIMRIIERERKKCLKETLLQGVGHEFQSLLAICNRDAVPASRRYLGLRFTKWLVLVLTVETAMR
ncbi:uncharacterized protein EAE97_001636 [Botrytis byssoidea]|uniref:Uncharacterized protein n=1 Tax=Botrytis byssoidea TaxID=139641 RepID=A0A9P5IUL5_9HELO|nr:uncharacterized protein EAE97_001636 [Botrytis byssoidea]KAF7952139.1 hypothetical protein EAE97_001636 [Botrytis byssoidea]